MKSPSRTKHWLPPKAIIGVAHLLPLPGSPRWGGDLEKVLDRAREDARALASGGVSAIIVENFGDAPLEKETVGPHTVAAMTLAVEAVRGVADVPIGVNVLRNDARSAMAVAYVAGARFIRVNVHTGAMVGDEGIIEGRAAETLRYRRQLGAEVEIFADVLVKHAVPLGAQDIYHATRTARERGLADALIVSGPMTGEATSIEDVAAAKQAVRDAPVLIGSGLDERNIGELLSAADGAIVGTSLKVNGVVTNPVDPKRVARLVKLAEGLR
ncbi:MAG: BtpA/SgcQ family protein [Chloroflexi bacterium]|nr:BtpA/SgcQ family protein [Chloroflexota bacterium]